jgi:hypothetical protein
MNSRILLPLVLLSLFVIQLPVSSSNILAAVGIPNVAFCDLLKNPQLYNGKVIRTRAVFRRGGEETADFYCPDCLDTGRVALDIDDRYESCTKAKLREKFRKDGMYSVVMTGKFYVAEPGLGYGHLGKYHFKFVVSCIEKIRKDGK